MSPISKAEALSLLHKAEDDKLPVELVAEGENQQAAFVVGFVSVDLDQQAFQVYVPGQIAIAIDLDDARLAYGDPREAPEHHKARAQRLLQFAIGVEKAEWKFLLRVWNQPNSSGRKK